MRFILCLWFGSVSLNLVQAQQSVKPDSAEWKATEAVLKKEGFRIYEHDYHFYGQKIPLVQIDKPFVRVKFLPEVPFPHCVYLQYSKFSDDEIIALNKRKNMVVCDVGWSDVTDKAIKGLVESETLKHLCVTNTKITDDCCESISKSKSLTGLQIFFVHGVTGKGLATLLQKKDWEVLFFGHELVLTEEQLKSFSGQTKLKKLMIESMKDVPKMFEYLKDSKDLESLTILNSDNDAKSLHTFAQFTKLKDLHIHPSHAKNVDIEAISKLKDLETLRLSYAEFDDASLKHLQNCKNLKEIHLLLCRQTDEAIPVLSTMKQLKGLTLTGAKISEEGMKKLRAALPDCVIKQ